MLVSSPKTQVSRTGYYFLRLFLQFFPFFFHLLFLTISSYIIASFEHKDDATGLGRVCDARYSEVTERQTATCVTPAAKASRQLSQNDEALPPVQQASTSPFSDVQTLGDELRFMRTDLARLSKRAARKSSTQTLFTT